MRHATALIMLVAAIALGGCSAAVSTAIKAIDNAPDLVTINREAELAYESGEAAKAEALYKSLARRVPTDAEIWLRLGNLYARNNRPDEAANAYQRALMINNAESRAWHNLSVVRLRQAWAALLQAQATTGAKDALAPQVDAALEHLAKLPALETEPRRAGPMGDATRY